MNAMSSRPVGTISSLLVAFFYVSCSLAEAQNADNGVWHAFGGLADGCAGSVRAEAVAANGDLYVGGSFRVCGDVAASTIARWDGSSWSALGGGTNGTVYAIAVAGSDVFVAGAFTSAGGVTANNVARWDGAAWHALGSGIANSAVSVQGSAIAVLGTDVYVGGMFDSAGGAPASSIARWDSVAQTWSTVDTGVTFAGTSGTVNALAVLNGRLYAGGRFDKAGGSVASNIAMWDGNTWAALGSGANSFVNALAVGGNTLYVGGTFSQTGGIAAYRVAAWSGTAWSAVGASAANGVSPYVLALALGSDGLYAGGKYFDASGTSRSYMARWDGSQWLDLRTGLPPSQFSLSVLALAVSHQKVYAGGRFNGLSSTTAHFIASWDGSVWSALSASSGNGIASAVNSLATYAGVTCVGTAWPAEYDQGSVACWNGASWSAVGGSPFNSPLGVSVLLGSGNDLYIGYYGLGSCCLTSWNGANYVAVGTGGTAGMDSDVLTVLVSGGNVFAGGDFSYAGSVSAPGIAYWDGAAWHPLGNGVGFDVTALAMFGGKLYAGTTYGSVFAWDGQSWSSVGVFDGSVYALLAVDNALYVGGSFTHVGGAAANSLARWDGGLWTGLAIPSGNGVTYHGATGAVNALANTGTVLYAGGQFDSAGGIAANDIVRWDGTTFSSLGAGTTNGIESSGNVSALTVNGADIYVGGQFGTAGGQLSSCVGRYTPDEIFGSVFE
jgi:hypothetical protein